MGAQRLLTQVWVPAQTGHLQCDVCLVTLYACFRSHRERAPRPPSLSTYCASGLLWVPGQE